MQNKEQSVTQNEQGMKHEDVETQRKWFSPETRKALEKRGYQFYWLNALTIDDVRKLGLKISPESRSEGTFENERSLNSEVAIRPDRLFLEPTYDLSSIDAMIQPSRLDRPTFERQQALIELFSLELKENHISAKATMGSAADYVELTLRYFEQTGKFLFKSFGKNANRYPYTRTTSMAKPSRFEFLSDMLSYYVIVGGHTEEGGLVLNYIMRKGEAERMCGVMPLVIPR